MNNKSQLTENTKIDLYKHFNDVVKFTDEEYAKVEECFYLLTFKKGEHLFMEGTVPQFGAYIQKGCVRYYSTDNEGNDQTIAFFTEGECVADCNATMNNQPVSYSAETLEDCEFICLNHAHYEFLSRNCPPFLQFYVSKKEIQAREQIEHFCSIKSKPAQERYLDILKTRSSLILRVPQHYIASYIGVHSRSFSRLKREVFELESCTPQTRFYNILNS